MFYILVGGLCLLFVWGKWSSWIKAHTGIYCNTFPGNLFWLWSRDPLHRWGRMREGSHRVFYNMLLLKNKRQPERCLSPLCGQRLVRVPSHSASVVLSHPDLRRWAAVLAPNQLLLLNHSSYFTTHWSWFLTERACNEHLTSKNAFVNNELDMAVTSICSFVLCVCVCVSSTGEEE